MYRLVFQTGPFRGRRIAVQQGSVVIGRGADCVLRVPDPDMADRHAALEQHHDGVYINALSPSHPLLVNGQETRQAKLRHGDMIQLGQTRALCQMQLPSVIQQNRKLSFLQYLTLVMVVFLLLLELFFVVLLSVWRHEPGVGLTPTAATPAAQAAAATATAAPPPATATAPAVEAEPTATATPIPTATTEPDATPAAAAPEPTPEPGPENTATPTAIPAPTATAAPIEWLNVADLEKTYGVENDPLFYITRTMTEEADWAMAEGDTEKAAQQLERVQIIAPNYYPALAKYAELQEKAGKPEAAAAAWTKLKAAAQGTPWEGLAAGHLEQLGY